jgi:hypothetical protein
MKETITYVGLDPAFRTDGFSVCEITGDEVRFLIMHRFVDFIDYVDMRKKTTKICFMVENSNLQESTFDMVGTKSEVARKSRNVGKNQAVSQIAVELLQEYFVNVFDVSPKEKGAKWTEAQFREVLRSNNHTLLSGKKTSNQDERDSYKLAMLLKNRVRIGVHILK